MTPDEENELIENYDVQMEVARAASYQQSDSLIITISSAVLALSISFVANFIGKHRFLYIGWLKRGWFFLLVSIISVLISFYLARAAYGSQQASLRRYRIAETEDAKAEILAQKDDWRRATVAANASAAIAMGIGIICIVYFASLNITAANYVWPTQPQAVPPIIPPKADAKPPAVNRLTPLIKHSSLPIYDHIQTNKLVNPIYRKHKHRRKVRTHISRQHSRCIRQEDAPITIISIGGMVSMSVEQPANNEQHDVNEGHPGPDWRKQVPLPKKEPNKAKSTQADTTKENSKKNRSNKK